MFESPLLVGDSLFLGTSGLRVRRIHTLSRLKPSNSGSGKND